MKFAFAMLKDFVATTRSAEEVGSLLTMAGFELEGIEEVEGEMMLDIKVVSNRGDGLSVLGLAREVLAKDDGANPTALYERAKARFPMPDERAPDAAKLASASIESAECRRYSARIYEGDFDRPSPEWVQKRLRIGGVRAISLLVDLTNYVMLEVGQPLHAFDLDKLSGQKIIVREATRGECLTTLNGEVHELNGQMMICDGEKPVGVPGVMGGLDTEVTPETKRMLLESGNFLNTNVRRTRKQLGLSTEASYRFERSVDPDGTVGALNRFTELLFEADPNAVAVKGVIDVYPAPSTREGIRVRFARASQLLGMDVPPAKALMYLCKLGFEPAPTERTRSIDAMTSEERAKLIASEGARALAEEIEMIPPSWRPDVVQEYDVIEEIGRVHGFDSIPEAPLTGTTIQGGVFGFDKFVEKARNLATRLGFVQNVSTSLMDEHSLDDPHGERIGPRHPGSPEMALLRNSLWPNLADNARRNGGANLRLFEIGAVFGVSGAFSEELKLGMLLSGGTPPEHWERSPDQQPSFFSLKAEVEEVLGMSGQKPAWGPSDDPRLHPTRQASSEPGILIGQIHPDTAEATGLPNETYLAELDLDQLYRRGETGKRMKPVSKNPAVRRDIAILIDKSVPYAEVEQRIAADCGELLEKQWLFDVYAGSGIPEGKHSLTIALQIRKMGENLTDEEANQVRDRAVAALAAVGATQR